jgi:hypothetical protein
VALYCGRGRLALGAMIGVAQMTKISRSTDCGNSPKNKMVEDIGVALETGDREFLATTLDSEAAWSCTRSIFNTSEKILDALLALDKPVDLAIDHAISHGKVGSVNGHVYRKGKGDLRFCHIIEFTSTKCDRIKRIESYGG